MVDGTLIVVVVIVDNLVVEIDGTLVVVICG